MNDDAIFLTYRVDCIAGKPPPTVRICCATAPRLRRGGAPQKNRVYPASYILSTKAQLISGRASYALPANTAPDQ